MKIGFFSKSSIILNLISLGFGLLLGPNMQRNSAKLDFRKLWWDSDYELLKSLTSHHSATKASLTLDTWIGPLWSSSCVTSRALSSVFVSVHLGWQTDAERNETKMLQGGGLSITVYHGQQREAHYSLLPLPCLWHLSFDKLTWGEIYWQMANNQNDKGQPMAVTLAMLSNSWLN